MATRRLPVGEWPWFISAHYYYFDESLAFILAIHLFYAVRALPSRSDCAEGPIIVLSHIGCRGSSTISGLGPRNVIKMVFSLASKASLYCTLHYSHRRGGSGVGLSQKSSVLDWISPGKIFAYFSASFAKRNQRD